MAESILNYCLNCPQEVHCCKFKGKTGFVYVSKKEINALSHYSKKEPSSFSEKRAFTKKELDAMRSEDYYSEPALRLKQIHLNGNSSLTVLKKQDNGDCIFLQNGKCSVYECRPNICQLYPYWFFIGEKMHIIAHDVSCKCKYLKHDKGKALISKDEETALKKVVTRILRD